MKKLIPLLISLTLVALAACGPKPEDQVKNFAQIFARNAAKNQLDSLSLVYPDISNADSVGLKYSPDNVKVLPLDDEGINFRIRYNPETTIEIIRKKNGAIKVIESKGLFLFPDTLVKLAENWGLWNNKLNDVQLSKIIKEQVLPKLEFKSPDLDFFNLHGPVKSMAISYIGGDGKKYPWLNVWGWKGNYEFSEEGEWINPKEVSPRFQKIERDTAQKIIKIQLGFNPRLGGFEEASYHWDNGRPVSFILIGPEGYRGKFEYEEENISGVENEPYNPYDIYYEIVENSVLSEYEYDSMGNWISCKWVYRYNENIDGNINKGSKSGTMSREITYY